MKSSIDALILEYNSLAESNNLKSRLSYDDKTIALYLCTQEGLEYGSFYSKLISGDLNMILQTIKAMKVQLCFELGE